MKPKNLNSKYNLSISGITQARRGEMICSVSLKNRDFKAERKYVSAILSVCLFSILNTILFKSFFYLIQMFVSPSFFIFAALQATIKSTSHLPRQKFAIDLINEGRKGWGMCRYRSKGWECKIAAHTSI
jgi:hypothetical protein